MILSKEQIRELREARRMSKAELARAAGVSASLVSQVEQGNRKVTQEASDRLAIALKQVAPFEGVKPTPVAELNDDETLIQMGGVTLRPSEKALLKALASAMLAQRN